MREELSKVPRRFIFFFSQTYLKSLLRYKENWLINFYYLYRAYSCDTYNSCNLYTCGSSFKHLCLLYCLFFFLQRKIYTRKIEWYFPRIITHPLSYVCNISYDIHVHKLVHSCKYTRSIWVGLTMQHDTILWDRMRV